MDSNTNASNSHLPTVDQVQHDIQTLTNMTGVIANGVHGLNQENIELRKLVDVLRAEIKSKDAYYSKQNVEQ